MSGDIALFGWEREHTSKEASPGSSQGMLLCWCARNRCPGLSRGLGLYDEGSAIGCPVIEPDDRVQRRGYTAVCAGQPAMLWVVVGHIGARAKGRAPVRIMQEVAIIAPGHRIVNVRGWVVVGAAFRPG